jgi:hypothetical protein
MLFENIQNIIFQPYTRASDYGICLSGGPSALLDLQCEALLGHVYVNVNLYNNSNSDLFVPEVESTNVAIHWGICGSLDNNKYTPITVKTSNVMVNQINLKEKDLICLSPGSFIGLRLEFNRASLPDQLENVYLQGQFFRWITRKSGKQELFKAESPWRKLTPASNQWALR